MKSQSPYLARKSLIPYRFALFPKLLRECRVPQTVFRTPPWQIKVLNSFATEWIWKKSNTPQISRISASFLRLHEVQKKSQTSPFKGFSFEPHYPGTVNHNLLFLYWRWLVRYIQKQTTIDHIFSRQINSVCDLWFWNNSSHLTKKQFLSLFFRWQVSLHFFNWNVIFSSLCDSLI